MFARGVGTAAEPLETDVDNIEADTTDLGIFVADSGAATVGGVSAALTGLRVQTTGDLSFTTNGTMSLDDTDGLAMVQGAGNTGTGGDITLTSIGAAADITAVADRDAVTAPAGSISLVAGRDITLGSGPSHDNDVRAILGVTLSAARDIRVEGFSDVASDDFALNSGADAVITAGEDIDISSNNGDDASVGASGTAGGDALLTAGPDDIVSVTVSFGNAVFSNSGNVRIEADDINIASASGITTSQGGAVNVLNQTTGYDVDLGSAVDTTASTLELSDAEFNRIFTPTVRVGDQTDTDDIRISSAVSLSGNAQTLALIGGNTISQTASLTAESLRVRSANSTTLNNASNDVDRLSARTTGGGASVVFTDADALEIGTVDGVGGVITADGPITLESPKR